MAQIHRYCIRGDKKRVENLLSRDKSCVNSVSDTKYTPLLCAVMEGWPDIVQILLNYNANIYAQNELGNNCLHMAFISAASKSTKPEKKVAFYAIIEMILQKENILHSRLAAIQYRPLLETPNNTTNSCPLGCIPEGEEKQRILEIIEHCSHITDISESEKSTLHRRHHHTTAIPASPQKPQLDSSYSFVATLLSYGKSFFNKAGLGTTGSEENERLISDNTLASAKTKIL
jgi:ankyrin repeat protein